MHLEPSLTHNEQWNHECLSVGKIARGVRQRGLGDSLAIASYRASQLGRLLFASAAS